MGLGNGGGGHYGSAGYPSRYRRSEDEEYDEDESSYDDEEYDDDDDRNDNCKLRVDGYCVDEIPQRLGRGNFLSSCSEEFFHRWALISLLCRLYLDYLLGPPLPMQPTLPMLI